MRCPLDSYTAARVAATCQTHGARGHGNEQLIAIVGLLVDPVEVVGILDGHKFGDGALFEDLLSALCHLLVEHLLLLRTALLLSNERATILLQALSLQDVSCLVELIVVSA